MAAIYSGTGGYLDRIKTERITEFHEQLLARLHSEQDELMQKIAGGDWDDSMEQQLGNAIAEAIDDFGPDFDEEGNPIEEGESDRIRSGEERQAPGRARSAEEDDEEEEDDDEEDETSAEPEQATGARS